MLAPQGAKVLRGGVPAHQKQEGREQALDRDLQRAKSESLFPALPLRHIALVTLCGERWGSYARSAIQIEAGSAFQPRSQLLFCCLFVWR